MTVSATRFWHRASNFARTNAFFILASVLFLALTYYSLCYLSLTDSFFGSNSVTRARAVRYEKLLKKMNSVARKVGLAPIDDKRPSACISDYSKGLRPDLSQINETLPDLKVTVFIFPADEKITNKFRQMISTLIVTTSHLHSKMEIGVMARGAEQVEQYSKVFENLATNPQLKFRVVDTPPSAQTEFHAMMQLADSSTESDAVVFLTSDMACNIGWLEALLFPLFREENRAFMVVPHFVTNGTTDDQVAKLSFDWSLAPKWSKLSSERKSEADEVKTLAFVPDSFAVSRKSPKFSQMMDFFTDNNMMDAISLDAAMFLSRCLNESILMAPCARLTVSATIPNHFEPSLTSETKKRIANFWLLENRPGVEMLLGSWPESPPINPTANCRSLSAVAKEYNEENLLTAPPK